MTTTVLEGLERHARERPAAPCYRYPFDHPTAVDWATYRDQVWRAARALVALGFEPGGTAAILGRNRPEWNVFGMGATAAGGAPVGIYTTSSASQLAYVVAHAGCRFLLVEDRDGWERALARRGEMPLLERVVWMPGAGAAVPDDPWALSWEAFLAAAEPVPDAAVAARVAGLRGDDRASLIYTSGTTGRPKGVVLTHRNVTETAAICHRLFGFRCDDVGISYLPLAHIAEQNFSFHLHTLFGGEIALLDTPERLAEALRAVRPTLFFGVPRVWEKIAAALATRLAEAPAPRRALARWAIGTNARAVEARISRPGGSGGGLAATLADRLVAARIRRAIGFDRVRLAASGAAPIPRGVLELFAGLGLPIYEVWGLSETTGPATWNVEGATRFGSVGRALPGVDVEVAPDGEVMVRGPNVFGGYLGDPEGSAEVLRDGWLATGDLGVLDDDGYLTITGRKKDLLITSGGKNVAPAPIEAALKRHELIAEAVVLGDRERFLSVLLVLDDEALARFGRERGLDGELRSRPEILAELQAAVDEVNADRSRVERVRELRVLPRPLSIAEGELTPTLKVKRAAVAERWADLIRSIYAPESDGSRFRA